MTPIRKRTYEALIAKFGKEHQIDQAVEELAELIVAIKHHRKNPNPTTRRALVMEIVDVDIMIEQLKMIYEIPNPYYVGHRAAKIDKAKKYLQ